MSPTKPRNLTSSIYRDKLNSIKKLTGENMLPREIIEHIWSFVLVPRYKLKDWVPKFCLFDKSIYYSSICSNPRAMEFILEKMRTGNFTSRDFYFLLQNPHPKVRSLLNLFDNQRQLDNVSFFSNPIYKTEILEMLNPHYYGPKLVTLDGLYKSEAVKYIGSNPEFIQFLNRGVARNGEEVFWYDNYVVPRFMVLRNPRARELFPEINFLSLNPKEQDSVCGNPVFSDVVEDRIAHRQMTKENWESLMRNPTMIHHTQRRLQSLPLIAENWESLRDPRIIYNAQGRPQNLSLILADRPGIIRNLPSNPEIFEIDHRRFNKSLLLLPGF